MNFKAILMGFAYTHQPYLTQEWSYGFQRGEADAELDYLDRAYGNLTFMGKVNTGDGKCKKDGVYSPVATNLPFYGPYVKFNDDWRKRLTQRGMSNIRQYCYPTVVIMCDEALQAVGMIAVPDRDWSGSRSDFNKNMKFFLEPSGKLQPPNRDVFEINFSSWRRELGL